MKKLFLLLAGLVCSFGIASAQFGIFNHLAADLSIGTTGISAELSTPITDFIQMRAGASFMPGVTFNTNIDGNVELQGLGYQHFSMDLKGDIGRTQGNVIFNVYPVGRITPVFISVGAYFGGKSIIKLNGHSPEVEKYQQQGILEQGWVEIGDYKVNFEENGNIRGGLVAKNFRPYLGIGFGRPCPHKRIGFMVELGVQFMGHMKVCQGKNLEPIDLSNLDNNDDWQKWMDKISVYPVLKFTLAGRLF